MVQVRRGGSHLGRWVLCVLGAAVVGAGCASSTPAAIPGVVRVVAGENMWGNITTQIGGVHVHVTSIISDPNADPHLYEASLSDAISVAEADVVIQNGANYDNFLSRMLGATRHHGRVVVEISKVLGITGSDANPHFWYAVERIPAVAAAIEVALAQHDPADSQYFSQRLSSFDASLVPLVAEINWIRSHEASYPIAYTERVAGYLVDEAGLSNLTPTGFATAIENGNDPSPADTASMLHLIDSRSIKLLLYNVQTVSPVTDHVRALARDAGIPVVGVSETQPPDDATYQAWQLAQLRAIAVALGGPS
jgi:zinc/manganese transport system substrate-binding protein